MKPHMPASHLKNIFLALRRYRGIASLGSLGLMLITLTGSCCRLTITSYLNDIPVTGVVIQDSAGATVSSITLRPGQSVQLTANVLPDNAPNKTVTWRSSDNNIATISASGRLVAGNTDGNVTITVTTLEGNKTSTVAVTVTSARTAVRGVEIQDSTGANVSTIALKPGESIQLTANVLPVNASNKAVTWSSGDNNIATISASGLLVAGNTIGNTTITVTTLDGNKTSTISVIVTPVGAAVTSVEIQDNTGANISTITLRVGESAQLTANVLPSNAPNKAVTWSSSDNNIATISATGLLVAGNTAGNATITVTTQDGNKTSTLAVTVVLGPIPVTGVEIKDSTGANISTITLKTGESEQLTANVLPANATNKTFTWSSSDNNIATISATGLLIAGNTVGNATITVTTQDGNRTSTLAVTVTPASIAVTGVEIKDTTGANISTITLKTGESAQLTANVLPGNATNKAVTWSSSNNNIATISATGLLVAGNTAGNATITVTTQDGNRTSTVAVTVTPTSIAVTGVEIKDSTGANISTITLRLGESAQLTANVLPGNATNRAVTWSSSNNNIATISATGLLVAGNTAGNATITVTTQDGNRTSTLAVTVERVLVTSFTIRLNSSPTTDIPGKTLTLSVGDTRDLIAADILPTNATDKTVSWSSADNNIATISTGGVLTVNASGTVTITATSNDGGGATDSITIQVAASTTIRTEADLQQIVNNPGGHYTLANDITLTQEWTPIGTYSMPFTGTLDGAGFTIKNLFINKPNLDYVGLIGVNGGTVKNIGVEVAPQGIEGYRYVGALVGLNNPGMSVSGAATGSGRVKSSGNGQYVGGLVGLNEGGTVTGYATVAVEADSIAGGLVGSNSDSGIITGYATGNVIATRYTGGGLVGDSGDNATINGYATGSVSSNASANTGFMGGLLGSKGMGTVATGYARGPVSVSSNISSIGPVVGGGTSMNTANLYYSGTTGESSVSTGARGTPNTLGNRVTVTPATTAADFPNLTFGTAVGQWESFTGKWPAINFPAESIFDSVRGDKQPINP